MIRKPLRALILCLAFGKADIGLGLEDFDLQPAPENWPSDEEEATVFYGGPRHHLPALDRLYEHEKLYYQMRWSEHSMAWLGHEAALEDIYRWAYRLHFPLWQMLSLAPGFDLSYADGEQAIQSNSIAYKRLSAGLGLRAQASFGRSFFTMAPYADLGGDFVSRRWYQAAELEGFEDGQAEADRLNQRLAIGLNFYFDLRNSSLGFGLESGLLWGEAGSASPFQGVQIMWRSP